MMFHSDITFVLALIALAYGALVVLKSKKYADAMGITCKIIGIIIAVLAILAILGSGQRMFKTHVVKCAMMRNMMLQKRMMPTPMQRKMMKPVMYKKMRGMKTPPPAAPAKK
ncbi:MAG: hypothetical protein PVG30_03825 [Gammaproteobacteria bacterium]